LSIVLQVLLWLYGPLSLPRADIMRPTSRYQVSAHIEDGGRVLFVTETTSLVITGYPSHADLLLTRLPNDPG
jgi:uncharacterized lipoprotein YbaY